MLPRAKRNAIVAVWDFCRAVDDAVDEAGPEGGESLTVESRATRARELQKWRDELARCFGSEAAPAPQTRQGQALRPFIATFGLSRGPFDDVIDGVAMDLDRHRYDSFDELLEYCRRVASAVGLIGIEIFGCRDDGAPLRVEPGHRPPAHQHHSRRRRRSGARTIVFAGGGPAPVRLYGS